MAAKTTLGFMILSLTEDWCFPLDLAHREGYPDLGLLDHEDGSVHVFPSRQEARAAIKRTKAYTEAFDCQDDFPLMCRDGLKIVKVQGPLVDMPS